MARIKEQLVLEDKFTEPFTKYIKCAQQAADATRRANQTVSLFSRSQKAAGLSTRSLTSSIKGLVSAYLGLTGIRTVLNLSDTLASTKARLDMMNDGLQTTEELNQMIAESALRSRGSYADTAAFVAKLGNLAGNAFSSSQEIVAFAEQINKQLVLSGASTQEASAAILQLTQGLSSGRLQGDELRSVLEQAPMIAKTIADYMGVTTGEMIEMASEGVITAEVVKNAVLSAADETNQKFESMPLTWGQAWQQIKTVSLFSAQEMLEKLNEFINSDIGQKMTGGIISAFQTLGKIGSGVIDLLSQGATWAAENWDVVSSVLFAVATVLGVNMVVSAVAAGAAFVAAYWPLLLFAGAVTMIIYLALQMGATWEQIGAVVGGILGYMYAAVMNNFIVPSWNQFANFANFVGNLFNDPVAAVKVLFLDMAQSVLGYLSTVAHGIEDLINKIPGLHVNLTSGIDSLMDYVGAASAEVKSKSGWTEYVKKIDYVDYAEAVTTGSEKGSSFVTDMQNTIGEFSNLLSSSTSSAASTVGGISSQLDNISSGVSSIEKSVDMSQEDLESLVDVAERRYVNQINLTSKSPVINVRGQNTGSTQEDRQNLADALRDILLEQLAAGSTVSTALPARG